MSIKRSILPVGLVLVTPFVSLLETSCRSGSNSVKISNTAIKEAGTGKSVSRYSVSDKNDLPAGSINVDCRSTPGNPSAILYTSGPPSSAKDTHPLPVAPFCIAQAVTNERIVRKGKKTTAAPASKVDGIVNEEAVRSALKDKFGQNLQFVLAK
jgi:hypothetical protein